MPLHQRGTGILRCYAKAANDFKSFIGNRSVRWSDGGGAVKQLYEDRKLEPDAILKFL